MLQTNTISEMHEGLPSMEELIEIIEPYKDIGGSCCIFDDNLHNINDTIEKIFTQVSHHYNSSTIFLSQNMFFRNERYRTMNLNTQYLFVMKGSKAPMQVDSLARQFSPYNTKYVIAAFLHATRNPYKYLLFDFHPSTPDLIRLRSDILPHEQPMSVYMEHQVSKRDMKNRW